MDLWHDGWVLYERMYGVMIGCDMSGLIYGVMVGCDMSGLTA